LKDANAARKIVGKKQMSKIPELKKQVLEQAKSAELGKYVWECGIGPQMGYSFSIIHALAYSFIGYQTAYLATHWNPIYWDTACLVVNSGSLEEDEEYELDDEDTIKKKEKGTNYEKLAKAIGEIVAAGIEVSLVNINTSDYGFEPDIENNRILYGLKALSNINAETIEKIKSGRPYDGIKDFMIRCPLTKTAMINLIKAGAFDEVETTLANRKEIMAYYILKISEPKSKLNLINWSGLVSHGIVPKELELQIRVYNFNKYIKNINKNATTFILNDDCIQFLEKFLPEVMDNVIFNNNKYSINNKVWDKIYQSLMNPARDWLKDNQETVLKAYNTVLFKEIWDKYATGNTSSWEMASLCYYHGDHELKNVDVYKYNLADFNELQSCEVESYFKRGGVKIPLYKLYRIAGTVISKNDNRHTISLLTTTGVVPVKFSKDYYAMFKRQISQVQADGSKKVIEKSWFKRGTMLMITGYRRDDQFVAKTYSSTQSHQLYKIISVQGDSITLQHERMTSEGSYEEDYEE